MYILLHVHSNAGLFEWNSQTSVLKSFYEYIPNFFTHPRRNQIPVNRLKSKLNLFALKVLSRFFLSPEEIFERRLLMSEKVGDRTKSVSVSFAILIIGLI